MHDEERQTAKQPGAFRHPSVLDAMRKTAPPTGSGMQPPSAKAQAEEYVPGMLSVRITDAPGEIPEEPLSQRISRRLLEEGESK